MKQSYRILLPLWALFVVTNFQNAASANEAESNEARLYAGFNGYQRVITTDSAEAQALFDQGIQLMYGFNHDEAIRSFQAAAALDPAAPMPWWGIAYSHGININDPEMGEARSKAAREAADEALKRMEAGSPVEKALIRAVSTRYEWPAPEDRFPLDQAYADKMAEVYVAFPEDQDVAVLYAEALMDLQPWDYWDNDGKPRGRALEMVQILESVIEKNPDHPGANHFYIHAVEASKNPDRAVPAAERLESLVPGSGHLVHMPSHIYIRVGRYADAVDSNAQAVEADRAYFEKASDPNMYAIYYAHNLHFLAYAAMMSGRYEDAIKAARDLERDMPEEPLRAFAGLIEGIMPTTLHVLVRFGKWEQILEEPEYADYRLVSRAVRHYARSIAYSALGQADKARKEMAAFEGAIAAVPEDWYIFNNKVDTVLPIAKAMVEGELLFSEGKSEEAFATLRRGIEAEDALIYDEPPGWMLPVRHSLGALLMAEDRYAEAEAVYREDLEKNRNNGWSLIGLQQALIAQDRPGEAGELSGPLAAAWAKADTFPTTSCFCGAGRASVEGSEEIAN